MSGGFNALKSLIRQNLRVCERVELFTQLQFRKSTKETWRSLERMQSRYYEIS